MYVTYYRVSTQRQGQSGLGLEAQRAAVQTFLAGKEIIAEFTEVESGRKSDRVQLAAALALAKKQKATLVIAKLDRLARNVHFISGLLESGVQFVAADMPEADRTFLQMAAVFAEWEAKKISERTKSLYDFGFSCFNGFFWFKLKGVQELANEVTSKSNEVAIAGSAGRTKGVNCRDKISLLASHVKQIVLQSIAINHQGTPAEEVGLSFCWIWLCSASSMETT